MEFVRNVTTHVVFASQGNPLVAVGIVFVAYLAFAFLESLVEEIIFGARFQHRLDIPFVLAFIAWGGYAVYLCAHYNAGKG